MKKHSFGSAFLVVGIEPFMRVGMGLIVRSEELGVRSGGGGAQFI
jgi:hypothetical protein